MKRPAFQFYPADWRKDVELRSCSVAARGLWMDMLCIAHECEPYGHLVVNGHGMTVAQIAGQVGLPASQCARLLDELLKNGVARKTESGVIYNKRMVDDERIRNIRAESGRLGGNPNLLRDKVKQKDNLRTKQEPTPSSSSSSSSSEESKALASSDESLSAGGAVNGDAVAYIPLADRSQWGVSQDFLAELENAYPMVDGLQTLKEIRAWCISNPQKCKTKTGVARFLNTWFAKVQNGS